MKTDTLEAFKSLWQLLSHQRKKNFYNLTYLSLISAISEVVNIGALMPLLSTLSDPSAALRIGPVYLPPTNIHNWKYRIIMLTFTFTCAIIISTLIRSFIVKYQLNTVAKIRAELSTSILRAIVYMPYPWHVNQNSAEIIGILTKDAENILISYQAFVSLMVNIIMISVLFMTLLLISPLIVTCTSLAILLFYIIINKYTKRDVQELGYISNYNHKKSLKTAQEAINGIRDVIIDSTQDYFVSQFYLNSEKSSLAAAKININAQIPRYLIEGFVLLTILILSSLLAVYGNGFKNQLPLIGALALGAYRLLQPLQQAFNSLNNVYSGQVSYEILRQLLSRPNYPDPRRRNKTDQESLSTTTNSSLSFKPSSIFENNYRIEFHNVSYTYPHSAIPALKSIAISVSCGERLGIVGGSGSGKSTLCDLLLGLIQPTQGSININGNELHKEMEILREWRKSIAHVPQEIYLADLSIEANIAFGKPEINFDKPFINEVLNLSCAAEFVNSLPNGTKTLVGDRGARLSGGQRQRLGIARGLYKRANVLVLDEATSALDNITEKSVLDNLKTLSSRLSIVMITHRIQTLSLCDKILVLEQGHQVGYGSFKDLKANNSVFKVLLDASRH